MLRVRRPPHRPVRRRGERGISLVLSSLLLLSMLGVSGLAVDLGAWQLEASHQQKAADAAALAGVVRLPDGDAAAIARAVEVAAANGYTDGVDGITVTVDPPSGSKTLAVTITNDQVPQYLTQFFRDAPTITRTATAEYVEPVPLGSPRNYLGTGNLMAGVLSGDGVENFWLAMSGPCTRREYGDRIATITMAIPNSDPYSCNPGEPPRKANPEYDADGYLFGVTVPDSASPVAIQMFDAPVCTATNLLVGDEQGTPFDTRVTVRDADDLDPLAGSIRAEYVFRGDVDCTAGTANGDCVGTSGALKNCWTTLDAGLGPGDYYVQVQTVPTNDITDYSAYTRHNQFSLRARDGATFSPCTSDSTVDIAASPPYRPDCPQVYGSEHLPIYANLAALDPVFFLASIDNRHNGKTMVVTLYDSAEGASGIQLLDPKGTPVSFTWKVLCSDGSTANGNVCPDADEQNPQGGRTGGPTSELDVSGTVGTGMRTFSVNTQNGKYSDRLIQLTYQLPADIATAYNGKTWWKISYQCSSCGDRTTWTVQLLGDPVRLVPNS